jgi:PAS domain S-box-containing protein
MQKKGIKSAQEKQNSETMFDHSEIRFRTVFKKAPLGIAIANPEGRFLEANNAFYNMLGYSKSEITGLTFVDITYPEDRPETKRLNRNVIDGKVNSYEIEKRYLAKDGRTIRAIVRATAIRDKNGNIQYWLGIIDDITQKLQTEHALRESEEKYRNIIESIQEGYFEVDLSGNLTFANEAACKTMGYTLEEFVGTNNRAITSPATARRMYKVFNQVFRTGRPTDVTDFEIITKDGTKKHLELSAALIKDSEQGPVGFRGVVRDVTERLRGVKEKERLASQVQHAQKMEAIGTLAGGIAHDFNNLLMGFQGNVSLMLLDIDADHPHYEFLKNMEGYVQRGSELTRQILGFARGGKYEVKSTNINKLLDKSADMFSHAKREISIHTKFHEPLWPVEVDRGQIEQVLLNLFVNAWQAMPGGGNLFLETENTILDDNACDKPYDIVPGKYVRISVTDTGVGMSKAVQERIFEPFFTTKDIGRGTGLGLASTYGIIKNHNGIITVYSEVRHGTTFKIYLPASDKAIVAEKVLTREIIRGKETILLVDDEKMVSEIGQDLLENLGYTVLLAYNGDEAVNLFTEHQAHIDLVILDMIMPGMGGGETYNNLKAIRPDIKVLLSSGYSIDGQATEIIKRGCNGFIQKPFNLKLISQKIREVLEE